MLGRTLCLTIADTKVLIEACYGTYHARWHEVELFAVASRTAVSLEERNLMTLYLSLVSAFHFNFSVSPLRGRSVKSWGAEESG